MIERQDSLLGNNLGLNNTKTHYIKKGVLAKNKEASKPAEKVEGALESDKNRQTYGFAILELMSEKEYQAWLRATAGMSDTEKIAAAHRLYPLADMEKLRPGKPVEKLPSESSNQDAQKSPFVISGNRTNGLATRAVAADFVQRYKNAFDGSDEKIDITG